MTLRRRLAILFGVLVLVVTGAGAWWQLGPRRTPPGQPQLVHLAAAGTGAFAAAFNAARDSTRLLALLSPT